VVTVRRKIQTGHAYDCLYPFATIDDPGLMTGLSPSRR
jgi:hypothetical protein